MDELKNALGIRFLKLYITLEISGRCILPRYKVSAFRGGIGEMLLRHNCIGNRECASCGFSSECTIQCIMHSKYAIQPSFATDGDSVGYVFECCDSRESFKAGDKVNLGLLLFGNTIVHIRKILDAIRMLGNKGIGKKHAKYKLIEAVDMNGIVICKDQYTDIQKVKPSYVYEYISSHLGNFQDAPIVSITMKSPLTLKYQRNFLNEFNMDAFCRAIKRRIYMLDCFEGIDALEYYRKQNIPPQLQLQECYMVRIPRYSNRKNERMVLKGLMGKMKAAVPDREALMLLLAGELLHIGKNTSFGFGEYELKQEG